MRLELTRRGDYGVRAMLALAKRATSAPTSGREIAAEMGIPVGFVPRVMGDLVGAGLVDSTAGRAGGYALARSASADFHASQVAWNDEMRTIMHAVGDVVERRGRAAVVHPHACTGW